MHGGAREALRDAVKAGNKEHAPEILASVAMQSMMTFGHDQGLFSKLSSQLEEPRSLLQARKYDDSMAVTLALLVYLRAVKERADVMWSVREGEPPRFLAPRQPQPPEIAIVMPWYNEEPDRFGCTATSGQQASIDANGNVQPCPLLKVSFGGIREGFRGLCDRPVRECLVYRLAGELAGTGTLPLAEERTRELWPQLCRLPASGMYERIVDSTRAGT